MQDTRSSVRTRLSTCARPRHRQRASPSISQPMLAQPEPPETCVICLDPITSPSLAIPCRHPYDYICLIHWLELRQSCPLCKSPVTHVQAHDAELGHAVQVCGALPAPFDQLRGANTSSMSSQRRSRRRAPSRRARTAARAAQHPSTTRRCAAAATCTAITCFRGMWAPTGTAASEA